jgi:hypothetical protein
LGAPNKQDIKGDHSFSYVTVHEMCLFLALFHTDGIHLMIYSEGQLADSRKRHTSFFSNTFG